MKVFTTPTISLNERSIRIKSISRAEVQDDRLIDWNLDTPRDGNVFTGQTIAFKGWALPSDTGVDYVQVGWGHHILDKTKLFDRSDVLAQYRIDNKEIKCGFAFFCNSYTLSELYPLRVEAVLENGEIILLYSISLTLDSRQGKLKNMMKPCALVSMDRSGSTFLMNVLGRHPKLTCYKQYPFEAWSIHYWMRTLLNMTTPLDVEPPGDSRFWSSKVDNQVSFHNNVLFGSFQQNDETARWLSEDYAGELALFCHRSIASLYEEIAAMNGVKNSSCFVEKVRPTAEALLYLNQHPNCKQIILVRDFRDYACSYFNFFGLGPYADFKEMITEKIGPTIWRLYEMYMMDKNSSLLLFYEDLVRDPQAVLETVLKYLEVDSSPALLKEMLARTEKDRQNVKKKHITAGTAEQSIGRWKKDLAPECLDLLNEVTKAPSEAFGYV